MSNRYYIYKYILHNKCIYVGKTVNMLRRHKEHIKEQSYFAQAEKIQVAECKSAIEMDIYELYYISKEHPKYNIVSNDRGDCTTFYLPELQFKDYTQQTINHIIHYKTIQSNQKYLIKNNKYRLSPININTSFNSICKIEVNRLNDFSQLSFQSQRLYSYLSSFNNDYCVLIKSDYLKSAKRKATGGQTRDIDKSVEELQKRHFIKQEKDKIHILYTTKKFIFYPYEVFNIFPSKYTVPFYLEVKLRSNNFIKNKVTFSREELHERFKYKRVQDIERNILFPFLIAMNEKSPEWNYKYQWGKTKKIYTTLYLIKGE